MNNKHLLAQAESQFFAELSWMDRSLHRFARWANSPKIVCTSNGILCLVWLLLILPTITTWNKSILWVGFLSIWANFVSHYTAWITARVEVRTQEVQQRVATTPVVESS